MAEVVLDASALIAFLRLEPGGDAVGPRLPQAVISAVNIAEVGDHYVRKGGDRDTIAAMIGDLKLTIVPADTEAALAVSELYVATRAAGLSLGDRFCLALGRRLDRPVLTADRAWGRIADAVGVRVELIR